MLFRDPAVGHFYKHDSPHYFSSDELHLGDLLECSRPEPPPRPSGRHNACCRWSWRESPAAWRLAARRRALHAGIAADRRFVPLAAPELDIVVWAVRAESAHAASAAARKIFAAAAEHGLYLALASFPRAMFEGLAPVERWNEENLTCLRACVMKPEHREWVPELLGRLQRAMAD